MAGCLQSRRLWRKSKPGAGEISAADDQGIPPKDVKAFEAAMKTDGKVATSRSMTVRATRFKNPNNNRAIVLKQRDASQRISAFFQKYLR